MFIHLNSNLHYLFISLFVYVVAMSPFLKLSPPPDSSDYLYNLAESEGVLDLFDVPMVIK